MRLAFGILLCAAAASAQLTISPSSLPNSYRGSGYASTNPSGCEISTNPVVLASAGGAAPFTYSVVAGALPPGLTLGSDGIFVGETRTEGNFTFTVRSRSSDGVLGFQTYTVTVLPQPSCGPFAATEGRSLVLTFSCSGTGETFTYSLPNGTPPPGVTVNPTTGFIEGVPTQPGSFVFDWRCAGTALFVTGTLTVDVAPLPQASYSTQVGAAFSQAFDLGAGTAPFTYAVGQGTPPPGIQVAAGQPLISGSATQAGSYTFDVVRTSSTQRVATQRFTINVGQSGGQGPAPALTAAPSALSFTASAQAGSPLRSGLTLSSSTGASFQAAAFTESGGTWLSVTPGAGSVAAGQTATLSVQADAAALAAGAYVGRIELTAPGGSAPVVIPVTLTKTRLAKQLLLTQTGLTVTVEEGAPALERGFFEVANAGGGVINFTTTAATSSGGNWLQAGRPTGSTSNSSSSDPETVLINPSGLAAGAYYGFLEVTAPDAANSPQRATVVLDVRPRGGPVTPLAEPQGAAVISEAGKNSSIFQFFTIRNAGASALTFTVSSTTDDGGPWLPTGQGFYSTTPGSSTDLAPGLAVPLPAGGSVRVAPLVRTAGLARGVYRGRVTLAFSNGTSTTLRLALVLIPPRATPLTAEGPGQTANCQPNQTIPVVTQLGGGGPPSAGWAQPISVQVVDDCGNPVTQGSAAVQYQGVASPQTPLTQISGVYSGSWTPPLTEGETSVEVTVTATDADGNTGSTSETVNLQPNAAAPPVVAEGGVVQAASFAREPLAPGTIVSIFGTGLSPQTTASGGLGAAALPLSTELGGTKITLAGEALPLLFVREDQVNAILPFELGDRAAEDLPLIVQRTDTQALSTAQKVVVSATRPGVFTQSGGGTGPGAILDASYKLVNADNAAKAGDAIVVFATGLGPTNPPVPTGAAAPSTAPFAEAAAEIRVTIGGLDAPVLFAGLSPGFAGLFQVNALVPDGVEAGEAELVIYADGQPSQTTTVAVR
ncbi:MAG: hypothetical protein GC160_00975 [Acidobacteria bacterium]|nr:hypothetical protein [Acidobacteriota bacterium]